MAARRKKSPQEGAQTQAQAQPTYIYDPDNFILNEDEEKDLFKDSSEIFSFLPEDENGFNQRNTNIYIKKDEEAELVLVPVNYKGTMAIRPYHLTMHELVMKTKTGKRIFPVELCIKSFQLPDQPAEEVGHCPLCEAALANNERVSEAKVYLFFLVIDLRGERLKEGGFSGKPKIGFYRTRPSFWKRLKEIEQEVGDLNWLIIKVSKDKSGMNIRPKIQTVPGQGAQIAYWTKGWDTIPNFAKIWAVPRPYEHYKELAAMLNQYQGGNSDIN